MQNYIFTPLTKTALSAATSRKSRSDCMSMRQGHAPWFYCSCGSTWQKHVGNWSLYPVWNLPVKRKQKKLVPNIETKCIWSYSHLILPTKTFLLSVPSGTKTKSTKDLQPHADIIAVHTSFNKPSLPLQTILITKVFAGILHIIVADRNYDGTFQRSSRVLRFTFNVNES